MASKSFTEKVVEEEMPTCPIENLEDIKNIRTISCVPVNASYYEKTGLRIEGDGIDHTQYNPRSKRFIMTVVGCIFAFAGSQLPGLLYLALGTNIALSLDATDITIWILTAEVVAMGVLAPFVGPMADLLGRKALFLLGLVASITGSIFCAATKTAGGFVAGQVFLGFGAITQELLAIAVVSEIVPTAKRSLYAAVIISGIIPWAPSPLYGNWMANSSWRWIGVTLSIWNAITFAILAYFYHPPPRVNSLGLSRKAVLARIDFLGGALVTLGMLLVLVGINWGGQQHPWTSAYVLVFILFGAFVLIVFGLWEKFGAAHPLFPRRIVHAPRAFFCLLLVIFAAGVNFIAIVVFWPIQSISVFGADRFQTGINTLPVGFSIIGGAVISALLITRFKKHITIIMTFFCIIQTVAGACMVVVDPHNIYTAFVPLVLSLIGTGGVILPNQVVITIITPDDLIASVTALTVGLRAQAQVLSLSIFYSRFVTEVTKRAWKSIIPAMVVSGVYDPVLIKQFVTNLSATPYKILAPQIPQLVNNVTNFELVRESTIKCFDGSLNFVYFITIAFGVAACIAAACMGDVSQYIDSHVAVVL